MEKEDYWKVTIIAKSSFSLFGGLILTTRKIICLVANKVLPRIHTSDNKSDITAVANITK